jgi:hypothetical protein
LDDNSGISLVARLADFSATAVTPEVVANTGEVTLTVLGTRFRTGTQFQLQAADDTRIDPRQTVLMDSGRAAVTFDLGQAQGGTYDLIVTHPDQGTAVLPAAILITDGGAAELWTRLAAPSVARRGVPIEATVYYGNSGTANASRVIIGFTGPESTTISAQAGSAWLYGDPDDEPTNNLAILVGDVPPGSQGAIPISISSTSDSAQDVRVQVWQVLRDTSSPLPAEVGLQGAGTVPKDMIQPQGMAGGHTWHDSDNVPTEPFPEGTLVFQDAGTPPNGRYRVGMKESCGTTTMEMRTFGKACGTPAAPSLPGTNLWTAPIVTALARGRIAEGWGTWT